MTKLGVFCLRTEWRNVKYFMDLIFAVILHLCESFPTTKLTTITVFGKVHRLVWSGLTLDSMLDWYFLHTAQDTHKLQYKVQSRRQIFC